MRKFFVLFALSVPVVGSAAPRLPVPVTIECVEVEAKYALVDEFACEIITANFLITGKPSTAYTVELYVEKNGTGERPTLVQTVSVTTDGPRDRRVGSARGAIKAGTESSKIPGPNPLPNVGKGQGWAYCLILKDGKSVVANTSYLWMPYDGKPD